MARVSVCTRGIRRTDPQYYSLQMMNQILGGGPQARLFLDLREEHGYTYGANSQFVFRRAPGPFLVGSGVRTDVTAPAVTEIYKEIKRIRDEPMSNEELAMAKDSLVRSLPSAFQTGSDVTASTATIYIYDLGLDYFSKYPARLSAVTAEQAKAAAQKYLVPEKLVVVAVGDRSKIGSSLQALRLGSLEIRNADAAVVAGPTGTR